MSPSKAPFIIVNRLAEHLFERLAYASPYDSMPEDGRRDSARRLAVECFMLADIFGEESQRRFEAEKSSADTEQAMAKAGLK